jgi:D-alanine transaminase
MSRIAYVDGAYRPLSEPLIEVEDRGYQFADAIYEVWHVRDGALLDSEGHYARLERSLRELRIAMPMPRASLERVVAETIRRNRVRNGIVYLQISRGVASRDHFFPANTKPVLVLTAKRLDIKALDARAANGVAVVTTPETRWARRDIKSTGLLPNVLARQGAREAGAFEAWFVDADGLVTEGTASNAWIVDAEGRLRTRDLSNALLHGVTRATLLRLARERQIPVEERGFTVAEALAAKEAFLSSAANIAVPIISIDGRAIGDGRPGPVARSLRDAYFSATSAQPRSARR